MGVGVRDEHEYRFESQWRVLGTPAEVMDVLTDVESLPRWCPAVYRRSVLLQPGDADHLGAVAELTARGWLGYTLTVRLTVTGASPDRCAFTATGDLVGRGEWRLTGIGRATLITVDWHVRLNQPLLRRSPRALRPLLAANHDWSMAEGERALRLELRRRRAATMAEITAIPAPPSGGHRGRVLGLLAVSGLGLLTVRRIRRRRPGSRRA